MAIPDVDLDIADRASALALLPGAVTASQLDSAQKNLVPHNTGLYFQSIPVDPVSSLATFPYDIAEDLGYYKIDVIPYTVYQGVRDEQHLIDLLAVAEGPDFPWEWFLDERFYYNEDPSMQVTHLAKHLHVVQMYPPESVLEVAALIALIRPRKKYLIGEHWDVIDEKIWQKLPEEDSDQPGAYFFKKSHAVAFALVILVHMQLIAERLLADQVIE